VPFASSFPTPHELTVEGIKKVVQAFADAAKRSIEAGFDVIEIHNAHGYLLSSFLSPISNQRKDNYGGSFENRIRLTLEVVDAIRAVIPAETPLFLRQVLRGLAFQRTNRSSNIASPAPSGWIRLRLRSLLGEQRTPSGSHPFSLNTVLTCWTCPLVV